MVIYKKRPPKLDSLFKLNYKKVLHKMCSVFKSRHLSASYVNSIFLYTFLYLIIFITT